MAATRTIGNDSSRIDDANQMSNARLAKALHPPRRTGST